MTNEPTIPEPRTPLTMTAEREARLREVCGIGGTMTVADQFLAELNATRVALDLLRSQYENLRRDKEQSDHEECPRCGADLRRPK